MIDEVTTASGKTLTLEELSNAEAAVRSFATNHELMLRHDFGTTAEDVEALCELAHECWFKKSKSNNRK